jgi:GNAT superfamily N-acetyltransferase
MHATYSAIERLCSGHTLEIRALRPDDRHGLLAALHRSSDQSRYRRFFSPKRGFTEGEADHFLNIDFVNHVALVAVQEHGRGIIAGGCRYIVVQPRKAEAAFFVADECQGQGIGKALMRHLIAIARDAGVREIVADVLGGNTPMLRLLKGSALNCKTTRDNDLIRVSLQLPIREASRDRDSGRAAKT